MNMQQLGIRILKDDLQRMGLCFKSFDVIILSGITGKEKGSEREDEDKEETRKGKKRCKVRREREKRIKRE